MAKKSVTQRIKITKGGKLKRRHMGLGHSRAGKSGRVIRMKRSTRRISRTDFKTVNKYLS
ncbi:MAG: 50S ribosomal protein L35 [Candidatus Colwellbacteria bacterium]|nr:50S ribosomal protein L35 [Candidatus Colwellbacteria bacterium]